jgi:putative flippase GtrA
MPVVHWAVFALTLYAPSPGQATSNLAGFIVAVSLFFLAHVQFTFRAKAAGCRYLAFAGLMGALSFGISGVFDRYYHSNP